MYLLPLTPKVGLAKRLFYLNFKDFYENSPAIQPGHALSDHSPCC
jgi:hypothetical protein